MVKTFPNSTVGTDASMFTFCKALEKDGYQLLGSGCFGAAYAKPDSKLVMKIGRIHRNQPYLAWIAQLQKAPRHENLPIIYGITRFVGQKDDQDAFFVVIMERLDDAAKHLRGRSKKSQQSREWYARVGRRAWHLKRSISSYETSPEIALASDPVAAMIAAAAIDGEGDLDMHYGNVMRRGQTLVITDPIC